MNVSSCQQGCNFSKRSHGLYFKKVTNYLFGHIGWRTCWIVEYGACNCRVAYTALRETSDISHHNVFSQNSQPLVAKQITIFILFFNCGLHFNCVGLSRGTYKVLGMIISVCLVHGGVGPRVLARRLYSQLSGIPAPPVNIEEVYDPELHDQLDKVRYTSVFGLYDIKSRICNVINTLTSGPKQLLFIVLCFCFLGGSVEQLQIDCW